MKSPVWALLLCAKSLLAQEPSAVTEAHRALREGIPQVAIVKLNDALAGNSLSSEQKTAAVYLLAEAQLEAGQVDEALASLQDLPEPTEAQHLLLRANIEASAGKWNDALGHYQALATRPGAPIAATLGVAESLQALGRTEEALTTLRNLVAKGGAPLSAELRLASLHVELGQVEEARKEIARLKPSNDADFKWKQHLEARILLLENNPKDALALLDQLLADKAGLSPNLVAAGVLASAEARLSLFGSDVAAKTLVAFIRQYPDSPQLELMFRRLDQIYDIDKNPTEGALHGIFTDLPPRAAALAQFYVARLQLREERYDRAQTSLGIFLKKFPQHELIPYAYQMQAELDLKAENLAAAEQSLDAASRTARSADLRAELALSTAMVNLQQGEYVRAATRLKDAETSPRLKQSAAYNTAYGWLMQQNYERFREELASFASQFQSPALIGQLRLEEGLMQARGNNAAAGATLQAFLREFPEHPRRAEAKIAMAELAFLQNRNDEAQALLVAAKDTSNLPQTAEQSAYLAVFLADKKKPRDPAEVIALAREFIARYSASPLLPDIRMKLGQVYFTGDDYLKAQEQFETLATANPKGKDAEIALFLAGQCGMKLMNTEALNHALELFDKVAERKGAWEMKARLQQAIIKNMLGAEDDAVKIYDSIIGRPSGSDPEVRYAALVGKGDNLLLLAQKQTETTEAAATLRERMQNEAIQTYSALLSIPQAGPTWRNRAAYKKGKAIQQMGRTDEALTVFYDILEKNTIGDRETFWFAKAGFDAAGLLEGRQQWKNAVAVYEKMARVPGPHVAQARQRIKTLQLSRYLWN
jgi:outer membrane protein assembly factor BamD (BamD/ComL family)